jgi:predicted nucleotide-binding protein
MGNYASLSELRAREHHTTYRNGAHLGMGAGQPMKVSELIAALDEFRAKLAEHQELLATSSGRRNPEFAARRQVDLQEQSRWLSRRCGALRPYIDRFDRDWMMQHPATGVTWDALEVATSLTGHPAKGHSLRSTIQKLDQILGALQNFDQDEEIPVDPSKPILYVTRKQNVGVTGMTIFIGHGRSPVWRELKDFLEKRLHLSVDEFNSVPVAGVPTVTRLEEMLSAAAFAFLVMTADDELPDGKLHARLNVVHEVGLFQGRLGFKKAIILLEEGCEEFSNIHGLGQIRFPKGNVSAKFEEIRAVLEREGLASWGTVIPPADSRSHSDSRIKKLDPGFAALAVALLKKEFTAAGKKHGDMDLSLCLGEFVAARGLRVQQAGYSEDEKKYRFVLVDANGDKYEFFVFAESLEDS